MWSPTLFPRGILIFQGVLRKFHFLTKFPHLCKAQPRHALLGYPFHNTAVHMEAMPTREGI